MQGITRSVDAVTQDLMAFTGYVMKTANAEVFEVAGDYDLTMSQFKAMFIVNAADEPLAMHELAKGIRLSVAAAGRAVDGLVRAGLVSRTEDLADRRVKRLDLTETGRAAIERIMTSRREGIERLVTAMDDAERDQLALAIAPILARITDPTTAACATTKEEAS